MGVYGLKLIQCSLCPSEAFQRSESHGASCQQIKSRGEAGSFKNSARFCCPLILLNPEHCRATSARQSMSYESGWKRCAFYYCGPRAVKDPTVGPRETIGYRASGFRPLTYTGYPTCNHMQSCPSTGLLGTPSPGLLNPRPGAGTTT